MRRILLCITAMLLCAGSASANNGIGLQAFAASGLLLPIGYLVLLVTGTIAALEADGKKIRFAWVLIWTSVLLFLAVGITELLLFLLPLIGFFWFRIAYWMFKYGIRQIKGRGPFEQPNSIPGALKCFCGFAMVPLFCFYLSIDVFSLEYTWVPFNEIRMASSYVRNTWNWEECVKKTTGNYDSPQQVQTRNRGLTKCGDFTYSEESLNRKISDLWIIEFELDSNREKYRVILKNKHLHPAFPYSLMFPYYPFKVGFDQSGELRFSKSLTTSWDQMKLVPTRISGMQEYDVDLYDALRSDAR